MAWCSGVLMHYQQWTSGSTPQLGTDDDVLIVQRSPTGRC
ncbi:unnamed protein product [Wuchereria bancrofti]|uniref:Uncharacterized protein n=1 Tax=Wuchereria bancrofti TaxID=6293 RepID=A0A3P7FCL7_WUCBA|nr:unnamed protein product [Wuchereria bancrofti]